MIRFRRFAVFLFCTALFLLSGAAAGADGPRARKVVRIPALSIDKLMTLDENNEPISGYAFDFIQLIGTYSAWDIEFVPCDSFITCINKLLAGEVDLFYDVSYTPERAKKILYPDEPMGNEYYYLYALGGNTSITPGDHASLNGKTVGVTSGTTTIDWLKDWSRKKNVQFKIVEYDSIPDKAADLYAGKIDLNLELSIMAKEDFSAVEKIGASSYYLVANRNRPDLIKDINSAMSKLLNNDLFYFSRLQDRYFSGTVLSHSLTTEEKEWIAGHKVLRIGYFDKYLPFCEKGRDGQPVGAGIDAIREIVRKLDLEDKLKIEFVCCDSQEEGYRAVESGEIDLMFPAYISNSLKRDYRIIGGKLFATLPSDLVFLNDLGDGTDKRIAVNRNNLMQYYYSKDRYPRARIVPCGNIWECLDSLLKGTSDGTFLNGLRSEALLKPVKYRSLKAVREGGGFELRMAFARDNIGLMLLMDRGLTRLDPGFFEKASYSYAGRINSFSIKDYLREHMKLTILFVALLAALVAAVIGYRINNRRLAGINRELTEYSETIEEQRVQESKLLKQLEDQQQELKNALGMAQSASRAKTTFLSNMSHDIRTPMNAIIGFTGLASTHIKDTERVQEYLAAISRSSEHLLSLINDILEMSRIEAGKVTLNVKPESLAEILHSLRDIVQADVLARKHRFLIDVSDLRSEIVCCDKTRLDQILLNLVSNAIKYTPPGGTICLRVSEKPGADAGSGIFEFRCRDNGIGMSEEYVKTIFEPFTREENSTVSGIQGTGLGMSITKHIVDMMGGRISVSSKKNEGTEFVVTLSFRIDERNASGFEIQDLKDVRGLVMGGDENACRSIAESLRRAGMRGEWCLSQKEAFEKMEDAVRNGAPFKVCIVDGLAPDKNGIETVRRIRGLLGKDAAVFVLTELNRFDVEKDAGEAGASEIIMKPLFPSDLRKALLRFCGKSSPDPVDGKKADSALFKGKRVLLVDDSRLNLKIGVLLLTEQGMVVDVASDGQIAVDMIREKGVDAYDFVLMDIQMPVMDGYEAASAIRKLPGGGKLKILAFSANAFEEDRKKSLDAGMDGHIAKPLKIDALLNELKRFSV